MLGSDDNKFKEGIEIHLVRNRVSGWPPSLLLNIRVWLDILVNKQCKAKKKKSNMTLAVL